MVRRAVLAFALVGLIVPAAAQQRDRASIPEKYKWDLTAIYPSNAAWRAAKEKLEADLPGIRQFRGTLGSSPAALADALERVTALRKTLLQNCHVRQPAGRPGHAQCRAPGNAAGNDARWAHRSALTSPSSSRKFSRLAATEFSSSCRPSHGLPLTVSISTRFSARQRTP